MFYGGDKYHHLPIANTSSPPSLPPSLLSPSLPSFLPPLPLFSLPPFLSSSPPSLPPFSPPSLPFCSMALVRVEFSGN